MERLVKSAARALRWTTCCAGLAGALALTGCGTVATVGSTVFSGAEAVGTLVKQSVNEEDENEGKGEGSPK